MYKLFQNQERVRTKALIVMLLTAALFGSFVFGGLPSPHVVKLNPVGLSIDAGGTWIDDDAVWSLFDRDTSSAYAPSAAVTTVLVTLPSEADIAAVKVYGTASYAVRILTEENGAWIPVSGLSNVSLQAQSGVWNTFQPTNSFRARRIQLEFSHLGTVADGIKEIEVWGADGGDPTLTIDDKKVGDIAKALAVAPRPLHIIEVVATPDMADIPADGSIIGLTFGLPLEPKLARRAYLLYESYNADYLVTPERRINGLSWAGGVAAVSDTPHWTSFAEEINPAWLVKGENRIEFRNLMERGDPGSYFVRDLKIVIECENGWNAVRSVTASDGPAGAVYDGDTGTFYKLSSSHTLEISTERTVQPQTLMLNLWSASGKISGTMTLQYQQSGQWKGFASGGTVDLSTLNNGWNTIAVPAAVSTDKLLLTFNVAPDKRRQGAAVGGIAELRLIGSSIGARSARGVVIAFPAGGEYFNRTARLQGFAAPTTNAAGIVTIDIEGKKIATEDGSFSVDIAKDETRFASQSDSEPWEAIVTALWPDGTTKSTTVTLTKNLSGALAPSHTEDSSQASNSRHDKFSEHIAPGQAKKIQFKGVTLDIPAGAVDRDTEITIIPLAEEDLARRNPGMINVTYPDAGYRFLPHGMKFKMPIKISFGYSRQLFAAGQKDEEVSMYYYDELQLHWVPLRKLKVDAGQSSVESESDHFTDIINATLVVPEHPQALSFNPNSIKDIKAADPGANIDLIEPPHANSKGTANLSYPIVIPKGRGAYTPELKIVYSSNSDNSWLGLGWNLSIPSIQVDTRWGVPVYDADNETESYIIDGQPLAPVFKQFDAPSIRRQADRHFYKRVEGDFLKIVRKGDGPSTYTWEVTDKGGIKYYYGLTSQSRMADYKSGNVYQWYLEKVVDTNYNITEYKYTTDTQAAYLDGASGTSEKTGLSGEPWVFVYPSRVEYTANEKNGAKSQYAVDFVLDSGNRKDVTVNGNAGFKIAQRFRLDHIAVNFQNANIRSYQLTYVDGEFDKSLLDRITVKAADGTEFYSHSFGYHRLERNTDGSIIAFADEEPWVSPDSDVLSRTEENSHSRNKYRGRAIGPHRIGSWGNLYGYVNAENETTSKFQDLNGDGLPDLVSRGGVHYNLSGPDGLPRFGDTKPVPGLSALEIETRRTDHSGHADYTAIGSYSRDHATTISRSFATLSDINGDGFIDLVSGKSVAFNHLNTTGKFEGGAWSYETRSDLSDLENDMKQRLPLTDPVSKWTAPFRGNIEIAGSIRRMKREDAEKAASPEGDGITLFIYQENVEIGHLFIAGDDYGEHLLGELVGTPGTNVIARSGIQEGDRIYFRLNSVDNGENDEVMFDPVISYTSSASLSPELLQTLQDVTGRPLFSYRASTDFALSDTQELPWGAPYKGTFTLTGQIRKISTPDEVHLQILRSTNTDVTSWDSVVKDYVFAANAEETVDFNETIAAEENERFLFLVTSGVNFDPARFQVTAQATYSSLRACSLAGDMSGLVCEDTGVADPSATDEEGNPLYSFKPNISYLYRVMIPNGSTATWVAPYDGTINIKGAVARTGYTQAFTANVMSINKSYWNAQVPAGLSQPILNSDSTPTTWPHDITMQVTAGEQLFFEIRSEYPFDESGTAAWKPEIRYEEQCRTDAATGGRVCDPVRCDYDAEGTIVCTGGTVQPYNQPKVQFYSEEPVSHKEPFGGGFRHWTYGLWNGNVPWDQSLIVVRQPENEEDDPFKNYVRMSPLQEGTAYSGGQPVWTSFEDRAFVAPGAMSSARAATDVAYSFDAGGVVRQSTGFNTSQAGSIMITGAQTSNGYTDTQIELLDMNGDRKADLVTPEGVYLNNGITGFASQVVSVPGTFRTISNHNSGINIGVGTTVNNITSSGKSDGVESGAGYSPSISDFIGIAFSGGLIEGYSTTKADLVDINGDGLPDLVSQGTPTSLDLEEASSVKVRLNLGKRFGAEEEWHLYGWSEVAASLDEVVQAFVSKGANLLIAPNFIRNSENRTVSLSLGVDAFGYAGASINGSLGVSRSEVDMIDVNGDGLPDHVMKKSGEGVLHVKINLGDRFADEQLWTLPSWNGTYKPDDILYLVGGPTNPTAGIIAASAVRELLSGNDTLTSSTQESYGHGYFVNIPIPIFTLNPRKPWEIAFWLIRGYENSQATTKVRSQITFADIDGDGLPDSIYKHANDHTISVRRNISGMANLLTGIKRPLGGNITLAYSRKGNNVDYSDPTQIIDMPHSQWVLSHVELNDGRSSVYKTDCTYDKGYYSRSEREFYGFRTVTETRGAGSERVTAVRTYHNQDYFKKGLLASEETREGNAQGRIYVAAENEYDVRPESVVESQFPYLTKTITRFYNVESQSVAKTKILEYTAYDQYGNVREFVDRGDDTTDSDDIIASIQYDTSNYSLYIVNKPGNIDVKSANKILRSRNAFYYPNTANLKTLTMVNDQGKNSTWSFTYDPNNGNLTSISMPDGDAAYNTKTDSYTLAYSYDDQTETYVTSIVDSYGYESTADYDYAWGLPKLQKDINGHRQVNEYDKFGRLVKVYGPYAVNDVGGTVCPPTVAFDYYTANLSVDDDKPVNKIERPAYALTTNRADSKNRCASDTVRTAIFADGLNRIIQIRKDAAIHGARSVIASGTVEFDSLGRVTKQDQPVQGTASLETFQEFEMNKPTVFAYDTLDRVTSVLTPDKALTTTVYDFGVPPQGGGIMFRTTVYDPNNQAPNPKSGKGIKVSYKDNRDHIVAVQEHQNGEFINTTYAYDPLGQITTVTDAKGNTTSITYDLLGHRLTIDNPDTGLTGYTYDANGNVTTKETAKLRKGAKKIKYTYDYNRLVKIDYPESTDVEYVYGGPGDKGDGNGNRAGRIVTVTDESGTEERWYGRLGETVRELRQVNARNNPVARVKYETDYVFDSFGRMLQLTYPDGEILYYGYDAGGLLKEAFGMKRLNKYTYIKDLQYDEFGQRTRIEYGNGVATTYDYYPDSRRLSKLTTKIKSGRVVQQIGYTYDMVGNILDIENTAAVPQGGEIGGPTEHHYSYDDLYQLRTASGFHIPAPGKKTSYTNDVKYDIIGNILEKTQTHYLEGANNNQLPRETNYKMTYVYDPVVRPHAVTDAGDKLYAYDENGNMSGWTSKTTKASRTIVWNEENRVKSISDSGSGTEFLYDDAGERVTKSGGGNETVYLNRFYSIKNGDLGSKQIFAGETRIATKLEKNGGGLNTSVTSTVPGSIALLVSQGIYSAYNQGNGQHKGIDRRMVSSGTGTTTTTITTNPPVEKFVYFYHGDHLGGSNLITDDLGAVYQDLEYFPYGETWVEDGGSGQMPMYRFTGKELDPETGLYYYGARYYDPVLSRWISADPAVTGYLNGKPNGGIYLPRNLDLYSYVVNNPVILKDADGNAWFNTITAEQANTRAYLQVTYRQGRQQVTQYTNTPATDLRGNRAIVGGHQYRIVSWSNPGAQSQGPRPVTTANTEIPSNQSTYRAARGTTTEPNRYHHGIDISHTQPEGGTGIRGQAIGTTGAGRVGLSQNSGAGTGNSVTVQFDSSWTNYDQNMHLETRNVNEGAWVNQGQQVGTVGSTGLQDENQYHLHYQTTRGGQEVNPQTTLQNPYPVRDTNPEVH